MPSSPSPYYVIFLIGILGCCNGGGRGHDCCWSSPHQRASLQYEAGGCWHSHSQSTSRALSPIQLTDEKLRELETDKESLRLQV